MSGYVPSPPKGYRNSGVEPVDIHAQRWAEYKDLAPKPEDKPSTMGCVFAKSCNLPDGVIDHKSPSGFVPVEKLADYTEAEFIEFINEIKFGSSDEATEDKLIFHFKKIIGHPAGSDLIFYPENKDENTAEEIVQILEEWRAANGLPGFKS